MQKTKILYLEDNPIDFDLVNSVMKSAGLRYDMVHVSDKKEFDKAYESDNYDIILCDYVLPDCNGLDVLKYVRERDQEIPFIIVSGTLGEESAIETLISGATDYVLKQSLSRLAPAIRRAIKENKELLKRKQAEENRRRYDFIVNTSKSFMILIDAHFRYEAVNEAFCNATGLSRKELSCKSVSEVHEEKVFKNEMEPRLRECLSGKEVHYEARLEVGKLGRRCYDISYYPYSTDDSKVTHIVEVTVDITDKKQAELTIRKERDKAQTYLDVAGVMIIAIDEHEDVTLINRKGREILNVSEDEILHKNWFENFIPKAHRHLARSSYQNMINGKRSDFQYIEYPVLAKDNQEKIIAWYNTPLHDESSDVKGILGSGENITDRKQAEESLLASEERYRTLVEGSAQSIISVSADSEILFMNKVSEFLLDIKTDDIRGQKLANVLPGDIAKSLTSKIKSVIKTKESLIVEKEFVIDGLPRWFELRIHPLKDRTRNVDSALVIMQDISERKIAEEQLIHSYERLQNTLTGIVNALTSTIEIRDPYTAGHQRRVSEVASIIAEEMKLSKDKIEGIRIASLVHDIGKIYVPTEILSKPGVLTESEFNLIKIHPQAGYDILKSIEFPWPIAKTILQHHERIDGSGYPNGVKGEDIIIEAKIICVADVVETMASHRPYRPRKSLKQAIQEITKNKDQFYDGNVVDACLRLYRDKKLKFLDE